MPNGRCRYHGKSTGAKNPVVKLGRYTKAAIEERKTFREFFKEVDQVLSEMS